MPVTQVNAGVGATGSVIGCLRLKKDVLKYKPDVILIEFSVNDLPEINNRNPEVIESFYETIVRESLLSENNPAVIILCTTTDSGGSVQELHSAIAIHYDLTVLSFKDVVFHNIKEKNISWSDIASDYVHPNDVGHRLIAEIVLRYFKQIKPHENLIKNDIPIVKHKYYQKIANYHSNEIIPTFNNGFDNSEKDILVKSYQYYIDKFGKGYSSDKPASEVVFKVKGSRIGITYVSDVICSDVSIYIDNKFWGIIDGHFDDFFSRYDYKILGSEMKNIEHEIRIKLNSNRNSYFQLKTVFGVSFE